MRSEYLYLPLDTNLNARHRCLMKNSDVWPISLLLFAATFAAWLGISGPLDLRNWQTLIAGIIAIGAAVMTYRAAMAKVNYDRETAEREVDRRKIGLLLKTDLALRMLADQADTYRSVLEEPRALDFHIAADHFQLDEPAELHEAWENMDVFPRSALYELRNLTLYFREFRIAIDRSRRHGKMMVPSGTRFPEDFKKLIPPLKRIYETSSVIVHEISDEVRRLAPEMPQRERFALLHPPPQEDEA